MRQLLFVFTAVLATVSGGATFGQPLVVQAPFGEGGTWNVYQVGDLEDGVQNHGFMRTDWVTASEESEALEFQGVQGAQVSIMSAEENDWIYHLSSRDNDGQIWIGLTDREGAAPQITNNGDLVPQESNNLADKFTQGWAWTTGEPFTYQAWGANEPNDAGAGGEDAVHIRGDGLWNDHRSNWGFDEPMEADLQPGTSGDETDAPPMDFKFVTEFNIKSPTPLDNVRMPAVLPTGRLAGPLGQDGSLGVVEYTNIGNDTGFAYNNLYRVVDTIDRIQSGDITADATEGQIELADVADPDTNANGGPNVPGPPIPYLSDVAGNDDNDIITVAHGRVRVTEGGEYTVQVRGDDGFALRFPGKNWISASANGAIDPFDSETLMFTAGTGDANSLGVINLPAGDHNVEFVHWERGGGAYYEVTTAQGAIEGGNAQWLALGDTSVLPDTTTGPVVNLTSPMFVGNLLNIADPDVEAVRLDLLDLIDSLDFESDTIEQFVIDDHNTAQGCPFNEIPTFHDPATVDQWPLNDPDAGGDDTADDNDFGSIVLGQFTVDDGDQEEGESYQVSFHVAVDDRSIFRIIGQDFEGVSDPGADPRGLMDVDGDDSMFSNWGTCNANYTGVITLTEGVTYDFEATHVEQGGDAGMQVLAVLGDHTVDFDASKFFPLTTSTDTIFVPGNTGLAFVSESGTTPGDYDMNGVVDAADADAQSAAMKDPNPDLAIFDEDGNGLVNEADRLIWVHEHAFGGAGTWVGDSDLDGEFNSGDFVVVFTAGKYENGEMAGWAEGDWDGNMMFDSGDFVAAFTDGGYELGPQPPAVPAVPEPSSIVLALLGTLSLMGMVRRRKEC